MGSLADLHSTPISPRELQALEPSVQLLVQDVNFISAVRDGALHGAAIAAVRLLKPQLAGPEFKRPVDRRAGFSEGDGLEGPPPRHAVTSPGSMPPQRALCDPRVRELIRAMRQEALQVEDLIPWNSVRRTWRNKRSNWRRQVKGGELVTDMAVRFKELRAALLTDDSSFAGCGQAWRVQLDACINGRGSHHSLVSVWEELKCAIRAWLDIRDKPEPGAVAARVHTGAVRAVQAMQAAAMGMCSAGQGGGDGGGGCMLQVPLESILNHSREELAAVQQAIDFERRVVAAQQQQQQQQQSSGGEGGAAACEGSGKAPVSYFSSINAGWEDREFDSGVVDSDCGSDATDLDSDFE